ncbi:MAG: hypothetical protein V1839_00675 [archaeon]
MKLNEELLENLLAGQVLGAYVPVTLYATTGGGFQTMIKYAGQGDVPAMIGLGITQLPAIVYGIISLAEYISKHLNRGDSPRS